MARLSTHVLDTSLGIPAAGIVINLYVLSAGERQLLATSITNGDGRTDPPNVADRLEVGVYELLFRAGDYLRRAHATLSDPPFLGDIVVRVGIADSTGHYHVPLLLSPYGYSTYRGS